jgi:DNA repair protein RecO (recombination protein O)
MHLEKQAMSITFLTSFELKLLRLAGYQPLLDSCRSCGKECWHSCATHWYLSLRDGGILCDSCSRLRKQIFPLSTPALEILRNLQEEESVASFENPPPTAMLNELRSAVIRFIEFHMEREIKSVAFLHQLSLL